MNTMELMLGNELAQAGRMDFAPFRLAGMSHCFAAVCRTSLEHTPVGSAALWHSLSGIAHDGRDSADYLQSAAKDQALLPADSC